MGPRVDRDRLGLLHVANRLRVTGRAHIECVARRAASDTSAPASTSPALSDTEAVQATLDQGVLTVRIPKPAHAKRRRIEIRGPSERG